MSESLVTRRRFSARLSTAMGGLLVFSRRISAADVTMRQYHNQPPESPLHRRLVEMWAAVRAETGGRVEVRIFPRNNDQKPGDPNPLDLVVRGELEFYTTSGNGLAGLVPPAEVQTTPYAFGTREQVFSAIDGALGQYIRQELRSKGLYALPFGCFENGFHQISTATRPIRTAADLQGLKIRAPGSPAYLDFFKSYGAVTTSLNINGLYAGLKSRAFDAQEDPLDIIELLKLYEVQRYVSMTDHSWSGYNLLASLAVWQRLPSDVQQIIERHTRTFVRLQRGDTGALNATLRGVLTKRGMVFNDTDIASFRPGLAAFYGRWRQTIGQRAWQLLEDHVGKLT